MFKQGQCQNFRHEILSLRNEVSWLLERLARGKSPIHLAKKMSNQYEDFFMRFVLDFLDLHSDYRARNYIHVSISRWWESNLPPRPKPMSHPQNGVGGQRRYAISFHTRLPIGYIDFNFLLYSIPLFLLFVEIGVPCWWFDLHNWWHLKCQILNIPQPIDQTLLSAEH